MVEIPRVKVPHEGSFKIKNVIRDDVSLYAMMIFTKCKNQEAYKIRTISPPNMVPVYKLDIYLIP